jgi:hypothetical protein
MLKAFSPKCNKHYRRVEELIVDKRTHGTANMTVEKSSSKSKKRPRQDTFEDIESDCEKEDCDISQYRRVRLLTRKRINTYRNRPACTMDLSAPINWNDLIGVNMQTGVTPATPKADPTKMVQTSVQDKGYIECQKIW